MWGEGDGCVFSGRKHVDESLQTRIVEKFVACKADLLGGVRAGFVLFRGLCVMSTVESGDFEADLRWLEWFVPGFYAEIRLARLRLTLFGAIDTVWRTSIAVFGLCDAAKWGQYRRVVSMVGDQGVAMRGRFGARGYEATSLGRGPAPRSPKYGHLLPTCRPRATMAA